MSNEIDTVEYFPGLSERYNTTAAIEAAESGAITREIAEAMGCSIRSLNKYERVHAAFGPAMKQARAQGYLARGETLLTIVKDNPNADIRELELTSNNTKWHLSKIHSSVFGDKLALHVEHVDLRGALEAARSRVPILVNPVLLPPVLDPLE